VREHKVDPSGDPEVLRIVLAGAESTGKTTLAQALSTKFDVPYVAEFGRELTIEKYKDGMETDNWQIGEFTYIAVEQQTREDLASVEHPRCIIADTDALVTMLFQERYLHEFPIDFEWPPPSAPHRIYLVPDPHVPFVADAIRDGEDLRQWMHDRTLTELRARGFEPHVLTGTYDERSAQAMSIVQAILTNRRFRQVRTP